MRDDDFFENDNFKNLGGDPLGGNVHVPGFDPGADDFDAEQRLTKEAEIDSWARKDGVGPSPLGNNWNTIPFGTPGSCKDHLFVHIDGSNAITSCLNATAQHLVNCPNTVYVVFHIGGSIGYLEWLRALDRFKVGHRSRNPSCKAQFVTRIAQSWTPRPTQRAQYWRGAIHLGATQNGTPINFPEFQKNDRSTWVKFKHRIWLIEELGLLDLDCGFIHLHGNQPPPARKGQDLSFGSISKALRIRKKRVRIYFRQNQPDQHMALGFANVFLQLGLANIAQARTIWSTYDPDFFKYPYRWLKVNELPNRRP